MAKRKRTDVASLVFWSRKDQREFVETVKALKAVAADLENRVLNLEAALKPRPSTAALAAQSIVEHIIDQAGPADQAGPGS